MGPLVALGALLGSLGLVVRFISRLCYLMTPVLEAELWFFPAIPGETAACHLACPRGQMEVREFPEYPQSRWAYRWVSESAIPS